MLIILEGVDGAGKSTLIEALANAIRRPLGREPIRLVRSIPTAPVLLEYTDDLVGYAPYTGVDVLCDRWHWGQPAYGPIYRGGDDLGASGRRYVDRFLNKRGALIVNLYADPGVLHARYAVRGEDYLKPEHVETVLRTYTELCETSDVPVMRFKSDDSFDTQRVCEDIIAVARNIELIASLDNEN